MTEPVDLAAILPSWLLSLRAERKSKQTVRTYRVGVERFLAWCADEGVSAVLDKPTVGAWIAHLLDSGAEGTTARTRFIAVRRFSAWLAEEDEIPFDRLAGMRSPQIQTKITPTLSDEEIARLLKACAGKALRDRRDEAIIRLMLETGMRAGEVVALRLDDIDLERGSVRIRQAKGDKSRTVPIGPSTGRAVDRYLRLRRTHKRAADADLWLGEGSRRFTYQGLASTLRYRAELAGVEGLHAHRLRHTFATRWTERGGSEGGLMAVAGWSRRDLIQRYTQANRERLAAEEARRLRLGDL